jgi:hypothetical protein
VQRRPLAPLAAGDDVEDGRVLLGFWLARTVRSVALGVAKAVDICGPGELPPLLGVALVAAADDVAPVGCRGAVITTAATTITESVTTIAQKPRRVKTNMPVLSIRCIRPEHLSGPHQVLRRAEKVAAGSAMAI